MDKVRFGIIGNGVMGTAHIVRLALKQVPGAVLTAICDNDPEKLEKAKKKCSSSVKAFSDYHELLDSGLVDAVMIATPHYLHPIIGKEALEKGINVLSEKPSGVYTSKVRELIATAKAHPELTYGMMYNQRTNILYRKAKSLIEEGKIGDIKRVNWIITNWYRPQSYYDQGGWRGTWDGEGGGVLINQCPHQIDLMQWLCGMPVKVWSHARYGVNRDIKVENDVTAFFEYENGATGVFITSTHDFPGTNRLQIDGDKGQIIVEGNKLVFKELAMSEREFSARSAKKKVENDANATYTKGNMKYKKHVFRQNFIAGLFRKYVQEHTQIFRNYTNHLLNGEPLIAPGEDGIRGLTISNAIHLSSWTGEVVTLPLDEARFEAELKLRADAEVAEREAKSNK